jgi:predicted GH43/DUF377 family glycosyl hydrolase
MSPKAQKIIKKTARKPYKAGKTTKGLKKIKRAAKRSPYLVLKKLARNPIISPKAENYWEAWQTFNPGVILLDGKIHFLYRAIGEDGISRFGYAASDDGFTINERLPYPVYEHTVGRKSNVPTFSIYSFASGGSFGGAEDPRLVRVNEESALYMTYTACDEGLRMALTSIEVKDFLQKKWNWKRPVLISPPGEIHKNWVLFPEKINGKYAILHSISPEIAIAYRQSLEFQEGDYIQSYYDGDRREKNCWDNWLRGPGAPPIKTNCGWLLFYHAMDENDPGKYKVGAMLLDLNDPTKVLCRSQEPILEPDRDYENNGFKVGVVYVSGAVVKDEKLLVYYGASDSCVSVAYANLEKFLTELTQTAKPKLKARTLKKK